MINLAPNEFITRVEGRSGSLVDQLTFYTNLGKKYGPYGGPGGNPFEIAGCVGGFAGRSGSLLDAFAVLVSAQ